MTFRLAIELLDAAISAVHLVTSEYRRALPITVAKTVVNPQARELVRGKQAFIRFNAEGFSFEWRLTVQRIVGEGRHAASWIEMTYADGTQSGL